MKEDIENSSTNPSETRSVFIGAKVTPKQKEYIKSQAAQCGMTVSDYLLARAYNYHPKARLTKEEAMAADCPISDEFSPGAFCSVIRR